MIDIMEKEQTLQLSIVCKAQDGRITYVLCLICIIFCEGIKGSGEANEKKYRNRQTTGIKQWLGGEQNKEEASLMVLP